MEWVSFGYALLVFGSSEAVWCFDVFVELCVGFGGCFGCFWVDVVE